MVIGFVAEQNAVITFDRAAVVDSRSFFSSSHVHYITCLAIAPMPECTSFLGRKSMGHPPHGGSVMPSGFINPRLPCQCFQCRSAHRTGALVGTSVRVRITVPITGHEPPGSCIASARYYRESGFMPKWCGQRFDCIPVADFLLKRWIYFVGVCRTTVKFSEHLCKPSL